MRFSVGEHGTLIMVEFNTKPGQNQICSREPAFSDLTDEVLEDVYIKKTLKRKKTIGIRIHWRSEFNM